MSTKHQIYLIDTENNRGRTDLARLLKTSEVNTDIWVFKSEQFGKKLEKLVGQAQSERGHIYTVECKNGVKNNMDFHIVSILGSIIDRVERNLEYIIVSDDHGYDGVISYWRMNGVNVKREGN